MFNYYRHILRLFILKNTKVQYNNNIVIINTIRRKKRVMMIIIIIIIMYYSMNNCRHNIERVITNNNIEHLNNTNTLYTDCICAKVNIIKNMY